MHRPGRFCPVNLCEVPAAFRDHNKLKKKISLIVFQLYSILLTEILGMP